MEVVPELLKKVHVSSFLATPPQALGLLIVIALSIVSLLREHHRCARLALIHFALARGANGLGPRLNIRLAF